MRLVGAVKTFFELKPGETLTEFAKEFRALTEEDKRELTALLREQGFDIEEA